MVLAMTTDSRAENSCEAQLERETEGSNSALTAPRPDTVIEMPRELEPNPLRAVEFLQQWPAPPTLTAIWLNAEGERVSCKSPHNVLGPKGKGSNVETRSFWALDGSADWTAATGWLAERI